MPWNIRRTTQQLGKQAGQYRLDVAHFIGYGTLAAGKRLALQVEEVACFNRGKLSKALQFGRAYPLGRIEGNFLRVDTCTSVRMEDKQALQPMIQEHQRLLDEYRLSSCSVDKGNFSLKNQAFLEKTVASYSLPRPLVRDSAITDEAKKKEQQRLMNRRAGIEALIGKTKQGGQLGRSRMKSDSTTLASGYSAVLGFNLRQMIRNLTGKIALTSTC